MKGDLVSWMISCLLLGLRICPVFVFAPPFSLTRMPRLFWVLFGIGLAVCLAGAHPNAVRLADMSTYGILITAFREAGIGTMFVLAFQMTFGALYLTGRTIDLQAGFGFALLVDPTSQAQLPLVGTLFAFTAGGVFFSLGGHIDLLRLLGASLDVVPLGGWSMPLSIGRVAGFIALVYFVAMGTAAATVATLFLIDMMIALLSRTVPQMNVLVLGFQVKTVVLFLILPLSFAAAGIVFARLMTLTLETLPRII